MTEDFSKGDPQSDPQDANVGGDAIRGSIGNAGMAALGKQITQNQYNQYSPTTIFQAFLRGGDLSDPNLDALLSTKGHALLESGIRRPETDLYLSNLEGLIRRELVKAGDEHFVELSMKLAQSTDPSAPGSNLYRMAVGHSTSGEQAIHDLAGLQEVLATRSLVLLGIPGSGKSTVLHHLALRLIAAYREEKSNRLPFFVRLTEYQLTQERAQPILEFLRSRAAALVGENHFITRDFEDLTRQNRFVFILDGLDQMPDRRSETIRLKQLKKIEDKADKFDRMLKLARLFRLQSAVTLLVGNRQNVTRGAAPRVDPREEEISKLSDVYQCAAITSCRQHDFIGVPRWETLSILAMETTQINEFIQLYAPGSETIINFEAAASASTRPLITSPFYLRMLTRAVKDGLRDDYHISQLKKVLTRRGKLLEYLISEGVFRYVNRNEKDLGGIKEKQERVDYILNKLGMLAYYMLERNVIGSVPNAALESVLGDDLRLVVDAGVEGNLITIHAGDNASIEFNHQLFLEFLLALNLKRKIAEEGGFKAALTLLSLRGDRWAETIRLLFEMVDEASRETLIGKFVAALRTQNTWDISTRVLSDLGPRIGPYVAPLLREMDEATVTGACRILGNTKAQQFAPQLVALAKSTSPRVRQSAVEALAAMNLVTQVAEFENDGNRGVLRAVFRARLVLEGSPEAIIKRELAGDKLRSEQMAFAVLGLFSSLMTRFSDQTTLDLLRTFIRHNDHDIHVLGFLMIAQSPDYLKRRLKSELREAALEDNDPFVNLTARRALTPLLDQKDLDEIKALAPRSGQDDFFIDKSNRLALRAYWLLLEAREMVSPCEYMNSLLYAPQQELKLLTKKLSRRADSPSLSFLTLLLEDKRTASAAVEALAGLDEVGVAYLLEALTDPSQEISFHVADLLKFCYLPRRYARLVRDKLRAAKVRTHEAKPLQVASQGDKSASSTQAGLMTSMVATFSIPMALITWIGGRFMGSHAGLSYWLGYQMRIGSAPMIIDGSAEWWVKHVELFAFNKVPEVRDADFWLARGRLERALGRQVPAKDSLRKSLDLRPDSTPTRLELSLIQRSLGNVSLALETLEAADGLYLTEGSDLEALRRLLSIEEALAEDPSSGDELERMRLLSRLGLWPEAQRSALTFLSKDVNLAEPTLVLFHAYSEIKQTRRALAAAIKYNDLVGEAKIRQVELEDLQWQHRSDSCPATEIGAFEIAMDLGRDEDALTMLRSLKIVPDTGMEISDEYIGRIQTLPPDVQAEVSSLISRLGYGSAAKFIIDSMPVQKRMELQRIP